MSDRRAGVLAIGILGPFLSLTAVLLRCVARRMQRWKLGTDDWLILVAEAFALAQTAVYFVCYAQGNLGGLGGDYLPYVPPAASPHESTPTPPGKQIFWETLWAFQLLTVLALGFVKTSTLFFYSRIFSMPRFVFWNRILVGVVAAWTLVFVFVVIFECLPVDALWNPPLDGQFHCLDAEAAFSANYITSGMLSVMVVVLPIYQISKLQLPRSKKIGIILLFVLSTTMLVAGLGRTIALYQVYDTARNGEEPYDFAPVMQWSIVQVHLAISYASLPCHVPLFNAWKNSRFIVSFGPKRNAQRQGYPLKDGRMPRPPNNTRVTYGPAPMAESYQPAGHGYEILGNG